MADSTLFRATRASLKTQVARSSAAPAAQGREAALLIAVTLLLIQEGTNSLIQAPHASAAESTISNSVQWLRLIVETTGACIIGMGVVAASYQFIRALFPPRIDRFNEIRLTLARFLALALEFQLGADILSTAIAPSWDQIGKLGAIAVIRTGLNYFLTREMREEKEGIGENGKQAEA